MWYAVQWSHIFDSICLGSAVVETGRILQVTGANPCASIGKYNSCILKSKQRWNPCSSRGCEFCLIFFGVTKRLWNPFADMPSVMSADRRRFCLRISFRHDIIKMRFYPLARTWVTELNSTQKSRSFWAAFLLARKFSLCYNYTWTMMWGVQTSAETCAARLREQARKRESVRLRGAD